MSLNIHFLLLAYLTEIRYLKRDEVNRFISCIKESFYYPIMQLRYLLVCDKGKYWALDGRIYGLAPIEFRNQAVNVA